MLQDLEQEMVPGRPRLRDLISWGLTIGRELSEQMERPNQLFEERLNKAEKLRSMGLNPYPAGFKYDLAIGDAMERFSGKDDEGLVAEEALSIAGRVITLRRFGKAAFAHIRDRSGRMQIYIRKDMVSAECMDVFGLVDLGDFVGVRGKPFKTRTGELTLLVSELKVLSKALRPLPEKWHGLSDVETRYRQRYLDLIVNETIKDVFVVRSRIVRMIREFFQKRDFLEVETPMMQPIPGGATARPFKTYHNALGINLYLRIAPELYLKRLVVGGIERVFELNRNFRNEGISVRHNPEFTMLEFYMAYATYEDLIGLTETLLSELAREIKGSNKVSYQGVEIDFTPPWPRLPLYQSLRELGGVPEDAFAGRESCAAFALSRQIPIDENESHGKILTKLFDHLVEPRLINPTFVVGYPTDVSPLSRRSDKDPGLTERFELFIAGREIANAFTELNDPVDQRGRFVDQVAQREAGDDEAQFMDEDFVTALEYGMPPTAGEGIGIDRVVMLLTDSPSIRDVILFPQMRARQESVAK